MWRKLSLRDYLYASMFTALIAVLGFVYIPLPFSPVPITGQTLAIMLAGSILTARQSAMSMTTFLLLGVAGVPVFSGGTSGFGVITGPKGGYLIGFLAGAVVISLLKGSGNNLIRLGVSNFVGGVVVIYAIGVIWLNAATGMGLYKSFVSGALPFIPGDIFKVFVATFVGFAVNKQVQKAGS